MTDVSSPDSADNDAAVNEPAVDDTASVAEPAAPQLRVLAGNPTESELAAVTAVLAALAAEGDGQRMPAAPVVRSAWSASQRQLRREIVPGPGAWNRQAL